MWQKVTRIWKKITRKFLTNCPNCFLKIKKTDNVCPHCGIKTPWGRNTCVQCRFPVNETDSFCSNCGEMLKRVKVTEND